MHIFYNKECSYLFSCCLLVGDWQLCCSRQTMRTFRKCFWISFRSKFCTFSKVVGSKTTQVSTFWRLAFRWSDFCKDNPDLLAKSDVQTLAFDNFTEFCNRKSGKKEHGTDNNVFLLQCFVRRKANQMFAQNL